MRISGWRFSRSNRIILKYSLLQIYTTDLLHFQLMKSVKEKRYQKYMLIFYATILGLC